MADDMIPDASHPGSSAPSAPLEQSAQYIPAAVPEAAPPEGAAFPPSPGPPQPPAKKSRKGLWIALAIIAFLILCCGGSCVGYFVYNAVQEQAAYGRAADKLEKAVQSFSNATSSSSSDDPEVLAAEIKPRIATLRTAIGDARDEIEPLSDSQDKTTVLKALASFDRVLQKLDTLMNGAADIGAFSKDIVAVGSDVETADSAAADGIDAANKKRWDDAAAYATTAIEKYAAAEAKSAELEKTRPGIGMADMQKIISIKRAAAEKVSALAKYGRSGSTSAYNRTINEYNDLQKQVRTSKQPAIIDNPDLLLGDMEKTIKEIETESQAALDALERLK